MIDWRIGIFLRLLDKHPPDRFFLVDRVRPEGVMHNGLVVAYEEANEIGELLVRDALYVQEELNVTSLDLRYGLNVDLASPDGKRLYFNIKVSGPGRPASPLSPWFE